MITYTIIVLSLTIQWRHPWGCFWSFALYHHDHAIFEDVNYLVLHPTTYGMHICHCHRLEFHLLIMTPPKCAREKLVLGLPNALANLLRLESGSLYHTVHIFSYIWIFECEHNVVAVSVSLNSGSPRKSNLAEPNLCHRGIDWKFRWNNVEAILDTNGTVSKELSPDLN